MTINQLACVTFCLIVTVSVFDVNSQNVLPSQLTTEIETLLTTTRPTSSPLLNATTAKSKNAHAIALQLYSSSSSSASSEDQLTPLLLNSSASSNGASTCVTCPPTVCTLSKVSYVRKTIHHNWRVNGLPGYMAYLEKFHTSFEMAKEVKFNMTAPNDGLWTFMLSRPTYSPFSTGRNEDDSHPMDLRVTYKYILSETRVPPGIAFDLWLSAHVEDEYVTLPSQISSHPSMSLVPGNSDSSTEYEEFAWTYLFVWSDIQSKIQSLMDSTGLEESQLVEFKFVINSYQEGNASSTDADCGKWNNEGGSSLSGGRHTSTSSTSNRHHSHNNNIQGNSLELNPTNNASWPPFLHHMYVLMKDDKYTDLTVKSGDEEFLIHRVIAAYSSTVLATMIFNLTYQQSESLLDFGEEIGSDVVEELIRYMYTGKVEDIEEIADRLIVAATTYEFPSLKKQCESVLIKQVKTENAFSMYALGAEVGSMRLKRRAFNIMKENKSKIVAQSEEFRKLSVYHPDVMYELFLS